MTLSEESDWDALPDRVQQALAASWNCGAMPTLASAMYSRWWQLETWLRSLVYVELRSAKGALWASELPANSATRQQKDDEIRYMRTPDAQDQLAYLDASPLLQLTLDQWALFGSYFPAQKIWTGRIEELKAIRNRIGHCRRPHEDDLDRLEQTLRDLNPGAFRATSSFNDQSQPNKTWSDVLVQNWAHETSGEVPLLEHARRQYDTIFSLSYSFRPWAKPLKSNDVQLGLRVGYVWHARWYFRGGRSFDLAKFWRDIAIYKDLIMLVCADSESSLQVSFSALEDQQQVSEAIGQIFDAVLRNIGHLPSEVDPKTWARRYANVDPRVHAGTSWASMDPSWEQCSLFGA